MQGMFHWMVSFIYLKASVELPFLFNIGFYAQDLIVIKRLQRRQKMMAVVFIVNTSLMILTALVLFCFAYLTKFELFE